LIVLNSRDEHTGEFIEDLYLAPEAKTLLTAPVHLFSPSLVSGTGLQKSGVWMHKIDTTEVKILANVFLQPKYCHFSVSFYATKSSPVPTPHPRISVAFTNQCLTSDLGQTCLVIEDSASVVICPI
jgi:hypothetical protein